MEVGIEAARWVVGRALGPVSGGVLEAWAASSELGPNIRALRMELLYAQGMLNNSRGHQEIQNPALAELLQELRDLAYRADDVLDELDYFRIQDELDGTYHAADEHEGGCLRNQSLNALHTARAIAKMLGFSTWRSASHNEPREDPRGVVSCGAWPCLRLTAPSDDEQDKEDGDQEVDGGCMGRTASGARKTIQTVGKHLPCYSVSPVQNDFNSNITSSRRQFLCCARPNKTQHVLQTPKLKFNRVMMSQMMKEIVEQLKPVCAKVSTILNLELLDSSRSIAQTSLDVKLSKKRGYTPVHRNAMSRPMTTSEFIETKFYGRKGERSNMIDYITKGECCDKDLTVIPIVGPGGIGKTTLVQYIYKELQTHFEVKLWVCVSVNFNVYRLTQEVADILTNDKKDSPDKRIEERLKSKRFLLVLDDMWNCSDVDVWKRFLMPFTKGQTKGCVILVTTRFPALAQMVKNSDYQINLEGLDHEAFKELFYACVFDDKQSRNDHRGLLDTGDKIVEKLKRNPLAAKTVGRLLRNHLDLDHWTRVLESKEWESQNGDHDIMPALKLSFDYLPFHLQQCFTYCALFPEDYRFGREELIHLWIGLDLLNSRGENKSIEYIGLSHLTELVNHGFFKKEEDEDGRTYYVIHDLLHELALKVSAQECLSIYSCNLRSIPIPLSIRHLSINIDDSSVKDRKTFDNCKEDISALGKRLNVENLRSLMLFGEHQGCFVKDFGCLFSKAKALRAIRISGQNYRVEDILHNFLELVHLRYIRIYGRLQSAMNIGRFYHMRVLDTQQCYWSFSGLTGDMGNLVKLRHFLVPDSGMHSSISEVGRLKSLQELRRFVVKKESQGFELRQIGHLLELSGSMCIENLEKVEAREEAYEAQLMRKNHLHKLTLEWDINRSNKDPALEEQVLEGLKPASSLLELSIRGHGGIACPSWLGVNLSVKNLESLRLDGVAWRTFPPIGQLFLVNEHGEEFSSNISDQNFHDLRRIELVKIAGLKKWVVDGTCQMFSHLEVLIITCCSELVEISFSHSSCSQQEHKTWFPKLRELVIDDCPKLLSLPPVPWTRASCNFSIQGVGLGFARLVYEKDYGSALSMSIVGKDAPDSSFWGALDFQNLTELEKLDMERCPPLPLDCLQMFSSLQTLNISDSNNAFWPVQDGNHVRFQFPVVRISIVKIGASGKELTQFLSYMPKLSRLNLVKCNKVTGLGVVEQQKKATPLSLSNELEAQSGRQQNSREEEEIAVEGLLLLPPQLQELLIGFCPGLRLRPDSLGDDQDAGLTGRGGGLQGLCSLRSLEVRRCPEFLSSYLPSSPSCFPFPTSLQELFLGGVKGRVTLAPLSNLASLTRLEIQGCGDLRVEGLWHLLAQGCLTDLEVFRTPNFFVGSSEPSQLHEQGLSSKIQSLNTDDIAGVLTAPICTFLSSSLTRLVLHNNKEMERFTKEQEEALERLTSLKSLSIDDCPGIRTLPKDGLPDSLQELHIGKCPAIRTLPKDGLPDSLQELYIWFCPGIRTLPKGGLPSSMRVLYVHHSNSEELKRQCRKLIGTIPIVTT